MITGNLSYNFSVPEKFWVYDETVGWANKPNTKAYYVNDFIGINSLVTFDEHGMRNNDNPIIIDNYEKKILVIGDSVTVGVEVANNKTYVALLEKLFQQEGYKFKFFNAGVRGYGTDQSLWNLKRLSPIVRPDYVIYMFCKNDLIDNRTIKHAKKKYGKPTFIMTYGKLKLTNYPSIKLPRTYYGHFEYNNNNYSLREGYAMDPNYCYQLKSFMRTNTISYSMFRNTYYALKKNDSPGKRNNTLAIDFELLTLILKEMKKINANLMISSITKGCSKKSFPATEDLFVEEFELIAQQLDTNYLNLQPYFKKDVKYDFTYDLHWNEEGHWQAAQALHKILKPILTKARP